MAQQVVAGAEMQCSFGMDPSTLAVLTANKVTCGGPPAANIMDNKPTENIPPFGMCQSLLNPAVASATAAALGTLTPQPCVPNIPGPWAPGAPTVEIANQPALDSTSKLACAYAGVIEITDPGQTTTEIP